MLVPFLVLNKFLTPFKQACAIFLFTNKLQYVNGIQYKHKVLRWTELCMNPRKELLSEDKYCDIIPHQTKPDKFYTNCSFNTVAHQQN